MTTPADNSWHEANQRHLMAALGEVRSLLERQAETSNARESHSGLREPERPEVHSSDERRALPALEVLCGIFGLSSFERRILLLCAGVELDGDLASLCAATHGDPKRTCPTFSLALAAFPDAHWSALAPTSPLRYWRLIDVLDNGGLTTSPLRIDERILHYLAGVSHMDAHLIGIIKPLAPSSSLAPSHERLAKQIADAWSSAGHPDDIPVIQLCGHDATDRRDVAAAACALLGLRLCMLSAGSLPANPGELENLVRLWEREAALEGSSLLLECHDLGRQDAAAQQLLPFVERMRGGLIVSGRDRLCTWQKRTVTLEVEKPLQEEQRDLWRNVANVSEPSLVDSLVTQFNLSSCELRSMAGIIPLAGASSCDQAAALWDACRSQTRPRLENLVQRIEPAAAWDDLVLPAQQVETLREVAVHVRQRARVYGEWGFAARSARGLGISALFEGASGTGKTMAAEVLAQDLSLDLYRIDLSQVVSKYIGETEKNLRQIFDAAESGGAILLFDEADALFGKRSEVKDSHDRYANIEVSYLLQRMETYRGLAILTTNMKSALDPAFLRRIRFVVQFPFPDLPSRAEMWRRAFPQQTPTEQLDVNKLARLNITGGNIRNIALNAAFLAANDGGRVNMTHLLQATRSEYGKLEKRLSAGETGGWS